jgi:hypothetical protein
MTRAEEAAFEMNLDQPEKGPVRTDSGSRRSLSPPGRLPYEHDEKGSHQWHN